MFRALLKTKVHLAAFARSELSGEGSCTIDEDLLEAAGIVDNERVHVWNIASGERFVTRATRGERGSGMVCVEGSAARKAAVGDLIIIAAFAPVSNKLVPQQTPKLFSVHHRNRRPEASDATPLQLA